MITYLASAYSHPDQEMRELRFREVCQCAAKLFTAGTMVFSPIAHSHPIAVHGGSGIDFSEWKLYDFEMLEKCDAFAIVKVRDDWLASRGVLNEFIHWNSLDKEKTLASIYDIDGNIIYEVSCHQYIENVIEFYKNKK